MDNMQSNTSQGTNNSEQDLIPLDERVILHGVAASLSAEDLEGFKQYLEKEYPGVKELHDDKYFSNRFTYYLPAERFDEAMNYAKEFLISKRPDVYETLANIRMKQTKGQPIYELSEEEKLYLL